MSCAPTKTEVKQNEEVTFVAAVVNATTTVRYAWRGPEIKNVNRDRVTTKYDTTGVKRATTTIRVGGETYQAGCSVQVKSDAQQQQGLNPEDLLKQLQDFLKGQQGGQQPGGQPGGQQPGGQPGGQQPGQGAAPTQQTQAQRETAAQQRAVQEYNRKQQQAERTFEQEKQQCETGQATQGSMADDIKGTFEKNTGEMGQMVPTDPKPIVEEIENIRENIERLTAKEIGLKDATEPALDQQVACKSEAGVKKIAEQWKNFLEKGRDGNPYWVTDYVALVKDSQDIATMQYVEALSNGQSCRSEENKKIAQVLASLPRSVIGNDEEESSCPLQQKKDLNDVDTYLSYSDPFKNPSLNLLEKYSAMLGHRNEVIGSVKYQTEINRGFIPEKDEDGKITNPPNVYLDMAIYNMNSATGKLVELNESTDAHGDLYADFLGKSGINTNYTGDADLGSSLELPA